MQRVWDIVPGILCVFITLGLGALHSWNDVRAQFDNPVPVASADAPSKYAAHKTSAETRLWEETAEDTQLNGMRK